MFPFVISQIDDGFFSFNFIHTTYIHTHKYDLLSCSYVHDFRADHLALDNQLGAHSRVDSFSLLRQWLEAVPFHVSLSSIGVVIVQETHCSGIMGVGSLSLIGDTTAWLADPPVLIIFLPLFHEIPLSLRYWSFVADVSGLGTPPSAVLWIVVSCGFLYFSAYLQSLKASLYNGILHL